MINRWIKNHKIVKGFSPRWLLPVVSTKANLDSMLIILNVAR